MYCTYMQYMPSSLKEHLNHTGDQLLSHLKYKKIEILKTRIKQTEQNKNHTYSETWRILFKLTFSLISI